jgi:hypothetical protein
MGGQVDGVSGLFEGIPMRDQWTNVEATGKNQSGDFLLQQKIGRVAADEVFFIHADFGEVEGHIVTSFGVGKQQDLTAGADHVLTLTHYGIGGNGYHGSIHASAASQSLDRLGEIANDTGQGRGSLVKAASLTGRCISRSRAADAIQPSGTESLCQTKPGVKAVRGEDMNASQCQQTGEHEADRPLAGDMDTIARKQRQPVDGFEDGIHRLEHGAFDEVIARGNFHHAWQHERHHADIFRITSAGGLEGGSDADTLILGALGESTVATIVTN